MHATHPSISSSLITLIFREDYKLWSSSLRTVFQAAVSISLLEPLLCNSLKQQDDTRKITDRNRYSSQLANAGKHSNSVSLWAIIDWKQQPQKICYGRILNARVRLRAATSWQLWNISNRLSNGYRELHLWNMVAEAWIWPLTSICIKLHFISFYMTSCPRGRGAFIFLRNKLSI
jgi:hypothetical protein